MANHVYWRWSITSVVAGPGAGVNAAASIAECVCYDSSNNPISTSGGTATASSTNGFASPGPSGAFDGSSTTTWVSNGNASPSSPQWLQMQFASAVAVDHFTLTFNGNAPAGGPCNFSFQYSDNGSSWTTLWTYQGTVWPGNSTNSQTFYTTGVVYRMTATAVQSGSAASFSGIKFYDSSGSLLTGVLGNGLASSWDGSRSNDGALPTQAYNAGCSSYFTSYGAPSTGSPEWVSFQFASVVDVTALSFQSANWLSGANTPIAGAIQKSLDGVNFTNVFTYTAASWTASCQTQTFGVVTPAQPYVWLVF